MKIKLQGLFACAALVAAGPSLAQVSDGPLAHSTTGSTSGGQIQFGPDDALEASFAAARPFLTWKYYFVPASAMVRRSSSDVSTYVGTGCIRATSDFVVSDIQIEDGASMAVLRVYYKDTDASNHVNAYVTSYDAAGGFTDYGPAQSDPAAGYGTAAFTFSPYLVTDNAARSYVFNVRQAGTSTSTAICGVRLFYSIP
ncbi:MAG: hypothetical protein DWB45_03540 [Xanthomonadales bacterium]|nr:hypothetical protein [Xanthomonadales bacterium]MDL1869481.1 hypothetical protein [Gammaproteobacteria bacterium PRO6]